MEAKIVKAPELYDKLGAACFKVHAIYETDTPNRYYAMVKFGDIYRVDFVISEGDCIDVQQIERWFFG